MNNTEKMNTIRKKRGSSDVNALLDKVLDNFNLKQRETIKERFKDIPLSKQRIYISALKGKSVTVAVKVHCLECVGWDKEEVQKCTSPACPLFLYRPYR